MFKKIDPVALARDPRTRKWGIRTAIAVVVIGILGFLAAPPLIKWVLVSKLGEALHREVRIDSVSLNPYTLTATVRGLSIRERVEAGTGEQGAKADAAPGQTNDEFFGFDSLRINAELGSAVVAGVVIKEIELVGPRLRLTRHTDKRYNISDLIDEALAKPKPEVESAPPRFSVSNIQISGGSFEFDDRLEGVSHLVKDLKLTLPFVSNLSFYSDTYVEPHFSAVINGAPLVLTGKSRPFADAHESELNLDLDNLQLARYFAYSPVDLPMRVDSGALDSELRVRFLQTKGQAPALTLAGRLALKDLRLQEADGAPLFAMKRLEVGLREVDLIKLAVGIERIAIEEPEVDLRVNQQGLLNVLALAPASKEKSVGEVAARADAAAPQDKGKAPEKAAAESSPLLTVDSIVLHGGVVRLKDAARQGELVRIDEISLRNARIDPAKKSFRLAEYAMRGTQINVLRARDGSLPLAGKAARKGDTGSAGKADAAGVPADSPWQVVVDKVDVADQRLRFEDATHSPAAVQTLELTSLQASNVSTSPEAETDLAAKLRVNKKGEIGIDGKLRPMQPSGTLQLSVDQIELLPLQPYFGEFLNITVTRGVVTAKGALAIAPGKEGVGAGYKGSLTVGDFHSVDKINSANFLRWKSFHFDQVDVATNPVAVSIGEIALSDFYARAIVSPEGKLNLLQIVKGSEAPAAPVPAASAEGAAPAADGQVAAASGTEGGSEAGAAADPAKTDAVPEKPAKEVMPIRIGKVTLQGGRINFTDNFVKPNYSANLTRIAGRITGLSSKADTVADLEWRGSYNDLAPLLIKAKLNPFAAKAYLDLDAEVKGVEMSSFSPYSGKYAGYAIEKGKLSLFLKYKIENNQLVADNRVFLDQLTFGETVDSPDATKLPVTLAVSLLKNRKGEIDLNLPISGSLDDPQFSIGGIIWKVISNLFVKAVTSPFALLGSLFGGGEELAYVEFEYGYAAISAAMKERLQTLAKALDDRPALKIELAGRIDPELDREGLKHALMMRRVKAQRLEELVKQGTEAGSVEDVVIPEKDYPKYLEKAYKAEKFPKPRNMIGLVKTLPVEEMEKLMLANMKSDDEALRNLAERRARQVAQWLTTEGKVPSERVFILQPHLVPGEGPQHEKAKTSRVDFSLK